ncbi:MAG: hypothetical protein AAF357_08370 [Verrucomicrobiota bacterium]
MMDRVRKTLETTPLFYTKPPYFLAERRWPAARKRERGLARRVRKRIKGVNQHTAFFGLVSAALVWQRWSGDGAEGRSIESEESATDLKCPKRKSEAHPPKNPAEAEGRRIGSMPRRKSGVFLSHTSIY